MSHVVKALRLSLVNSLTSVGWPWAILAMTFAVNWAIFAVLPDDVPVPDRQTGALASLYFVALIANLQLWTQGFPFAMGLSLTRKAYFGGTVLMLLLQSVVAGVALTALSRVEAATSGWGVDMKFFAPWVFDQGNLGARFLMYAVPFAMLSALGMVIGVVFKRWGQSGVYTLTITSLLLIAVVTLLVTWQDWWAAIGRFFTDSSFVGLTAGYPALLAVACASLAWLGLRRAAP
ncbi:hypothetical protein [Knoellia koreensis]|uniref:Uncharacterized protein n=1 Tax=Knoellia koreensis TaxID=2730921 RepID=A0A849H8A8_9MICO|nr:hypothetical protein [Knoellia sp. DB2414S]NNM45966.1 hypothetical protein [Knoellia sp. DB2414S]